MFELFSNKRFVVYYIVDLLDDGGGDVESCKVWEYGYVYKVSWLVFLLCCIFWIFLLGLRLEKIYNLCVYYVFRIVILL